MNEWIHDLRSYPIEEVAKALALKVGRGNRFTECPACGAGNRACSIHEAGRRWYCHVCGDGGDVADLVAVVATRHPISKTTTPEDYAATRALAASLGLVEGDDIDIPPRPRVAPKPLPERRNELNRPPLREVEALWNASTLTADERGAGDFLRGRGYWPLEELDELGIVRMLPLRHQFPPWWPYPPHKWRLVVRAFEATAGELASLHARAVVDVNHKTMWPKGYQAGGLFMPNQEGLQLLRGEEVLDTRVLVVEGLTGLLWTSLVLQRKGLHVPVLAGTEGSWRALSRVQWPSGTVVFAATDDDDDDGKGDKYAAEIRRAVPRNIPVRRWRWNRGNQGDKHDAGDAPEEVFLREFEMAEEMPYPEDAPAHKEKLPDFEAAVDLLIKRLSKGESAEVFPWPGGVTSRPNMPPRAFGRALLPTSEQLKWPSIHQKLGVWFPGRLGVLVGSTGSGKTAFAVQVAEAVAQYGAPVLYASAELDRVELAARFISLRSAGDALEPAMREGVPWASILAMKTAEPELIDAGRTLVQECPNLYLWAPPGNQRTVEDLAAMTKAVSAAHGGRAPFVVVDYVQRWTPDSVDDKRLAVSGLSARLRELSRPDDDGGWPGAAILALSSTARSNYAYLQNVSSLKLARDGGEGPKGPKAVELVGLGKETGELEYDAPLVMCLASNQGMEDDPMGKRAALMVVPKNRHGHRGSIEWDFLAAVGRFVEGKNEGGSGKIATRPRRKIATRSRRQSK